MGRFYSGLASVILVVLMGVNVQAGTAVKWGAKVGLSMASQTWEYQRALGTLEFDRLTCLSFGISGKVGLMPALSLQPEVLYVRKGHQQEVDLRDYTGQLTGTTTIKNRVDYVSLLALARARVTRLPVELFILGGPRLDFRVDTKPHYDNDPATRTVYDSFKSTVAGLTFGAGVARDVSPAVTLSLEFRYDLDLADAAEYVGTDNRLKIKNKCFAILAGMYF